jgi:hypothetical protein
MVALAAVGVSALAGAAMLTQRLAGGRRGRCELYLSERKVTYFVVPPGWQSGRTVAPPYRRPKAGIWIRFSGQLHNKGDRKGTLRRVRVELPPLACNGEGLIPDGGSPMPFEVAAGGGVDYRFWFHLSADPAATDRVPERAVCTFVLTDQSRRKHRSSFLASYDEDPAFFFYRRHSR